MITRSHRGICSCVAVVWLGAGVASAQPAPTQDATAKPWVVGVSEAEQETALAIFKEGNGEFEQARYAQALAKYREAIKHWEHPAIRFNIVVCLINLDEPLEAYESLELALKYDDAPLGHDLYNQALTYRKLLLGQLAKLEVASKEAGAEVTLDGKQLFTAPGSTTMLVPPGDHQIVAQRRGYLTETIKLVLVPGKVTVRDIKLTKLEAATKYVRRWPVWKPWLVIGAGAAIALIGVPFELQSATNYDRYNERFTLECPNGCGSPDRPPIPGSLTSIERTAHRDNIAAISLFALGGAVAAAGFVGVVLNQPRAMVPTEHALSVTPAVTSDGVALSLGGQW